MMNFLPYMKAARPVVLEPVNGSRIISPSLVLARTIRFSRSRDFWVGCLPKVFSSGFGVLMAHITICGIVSQMFSKNTRTVA